MDQATIARYQPGGDIYTQLASQYGVDGANTVAAAALTGDETQVNAALVQIHYGAPLDTSTTDAFINNITTNPLAAPISGLENQIKVAVQDFFSNPYVLVAAGGILFLAFGGLDVIKRKIGKL